MLVMDEYDAALLGFATVWDTSGNRVERAVYDGEEIVKILVADGMTIEEAHDHIQFNIEGAYVGPQTPILVWRATRGDLDQMEG